VILLLIVCFASDVLKNDSLDYFVYKILGLLVLKKLQKLKALSFLLVTLINLRFELGEKIANIFYECQS